MRTHEQILRGATYAALAAQIRADYAAAELALIVGEAIDPAPALAQIAAGIDTPAEITRAHITQLLDQLQIAKLRQRRAAIAATEAAPARPTRPVWCASIQLRTSWDGDPTDGIGEMLRDQWVFDWAYARATPRGAQPAYYLFPQRDQTRIDGSWVCGLHIVLSPHRAWNEQQIPGALNEIMADGVAWTPLITNGRPTFELLLVPDGPFVSVGAAEELTDEEAARSYIEGDFLEALDFPTAQQG